MRPPWIGILLLSPIVAGCGRHEPPAMRVWATTPPPYSVHPESDNAFDSYVLAAQEVEGKAGALLDRVSFTPGQRTQVRDLCAPAVRTVTKASTRSATFHYTPRPPFSAAPFQRGWRLIGRSLRWQAEEAASNGDFDTAIDAALTATRFGFDLTGGGATDASLGYAIADEARLALVPHLDRMGAGQLGRLAKGLSEALKRKPPIAHVVDNERASARLAIQALQDAYARQTLAEFERQLGPDAKEAVQYLRDQDLEKARRYFEGFADEAEVQADALVRLAKLSGAAREAEKPPKLAAERPWKRFARHFVATARPLLDIDDRTIARTRLFAITATLLQRRKLKQAYPRNLAGFPAELTTDPFTGETLRYASDGTDFHVYSAGTNLRDDGGDTDDAWLAPDLTLERREG